jgi:4-hydroxy-2-oxoheptanedioate aldolase
MRPNPLREIWQRGECVLNGWLHLPESIASEAMAHCGWDSLTIDLQHGFVDYQAAVRMLKAISTTAVVPLARVPWNEPGIIMRLLDAGCYGIICPMVNTRADCEAFVGACRYPPLGYRSFGPVRATLYAGDDYATHANATVVTMAMIETREAVANLEAILDVPGLDAIYIGPSDLGQSLGFAPRVDPEEPAILDVVQQIVAAAHARTIVVGMHTGSVAYAQRMAASGIQFVTIGSDMRLMMAGARETTAAFRRAAPDAAPNSGY